MIQGDTMFTPENEQGVIVSFSMMASEKGWEIVSIGTRYPDAIVRDITQNEYRAEFEYLSSHFRDHGHDPRDCDLIICWKHDFADCILPVLEIQNWDNFCMKEATILEKEVMHLRMENQRLRNMVKRQEPASEPKKRAKRTMVSQEPENIRYELRKKKLQNGEQLNYMVGREPNKARKSVRYVHLSPAMMQTKPPGDGWRFETSHEGKYFHWRRGRGDHREYKPGGPIE